MGIQVPLDKYDNRCQLSIIFIMLINILLINYSQGHNQQFVMDVYIIYL